MRGLLWVLALLMLVIAACATLAKRETPTRPLCGPTHPPHLGGCDYLVNEHEALP